MLSADFLYAFCRILAAKEAARHNLNDDTARGSCNSQKILRVGLGFAGIGISGGKDG